jgi:hypothetical protein
MVSVRGWDALPNESRLSARFEWPASEENTLSQTNAHGHEDRDTPAGALAAKPLV